MSVGTGVVLRGRMVGGGRAEGRAFVTRQTISGWGGIDVRTGTVTERRHERAGESFAGRVLVFPGAKGSSGWSHYFHVTRRLGTAPAAMLFTVITIKVALGAVVARVPALTDFDQDPFALIAHGDLVRVDADAGAVEVIERAEMTAKPATEAPDKREDAKDETL